MTSSNIKIPSLDISVNVICGIPASGKSTLVQELVKIYNHSSGHGEKKYDDVFTIDYDAMILEKMKHKVRDEVIFSQKLKELWKVTRMRALEKLKEIMEETYQNVKSSSLKKIMITLDDNFYLRSMRREVYKVCQEFVKSKRNIQITANNVTQKNDQGLATNIIAPHVRVGFVIIHITTPLLVCLVRNAQRFPPQRIPKQILHEMSNSLQPPDLQKAYFESFSCSFSMVSNETTLLLFDEINDQINTGTKIYNHSDQNILKNIEEMIINALNNPVTPKKNQEINRDRQSTRQTCIHRFDLMLRNFVGVTCRTEPTLTEAANNARKSILNKWKDNESVDDDEQDLLKRFEELTFLDSTIRKDQLQKILKSLHCEFIQNYVKEDDIDNIH